MPDKLILLPVWRPILKRRTKGVTRDAWLCKHAIVSSLLVFIPRQEQRRTIEGLKCREVIDVLQLGTFLTRSTRGGGRRLKFGMNIPSMSLITTTIRSLTVKTSSNWWVKCVRRPACDVCDEGSEEIVNSCKNFKTVLNADAGSIEMCGIFPGVLSWKPLTSKCQPTPAPDLVTQ